MLLILSRFKFDLKRFEFKINIIFFILMNSISNYYGKFISNLKVKSVIKVEDNDELKLSQESDTLNLNIKQVHKTLKENTSPNSNIKRKIKTERKEQLNNFEQFYNSVKHVKYNTLLDYSLIIANFA